MKMCHVTRVREVELGLLSFCEKSAEEWQMQILNSN